MSLSVCCITSDPPERVAAVLARVRSVADEIVVAVDSRVNPDSLGPYERVVDKLFRVEVNPPMERTLAWLHQQCSGSWILRLDGDEVPGAELLEALPELTATTDVVQYYLARRWLFPDKDHWLNEWPWAPDFSNRLVRRDPALWFPGLLHTGAEADFPVRYLELPIYHLVTATQSKEERAAKIRSYLDVPERLRDLAGDLLLEAHYLPEEHRRLDPVPVPAQDAVLIDQVLSSRRELSATWWEPPLVPPIEIEYFWAERSLGPAAYRARLDPFTSRRTLWAGEHDQRFGVVVSNLGDAWWPGGERHPLIRIAYRWRKDGKVIVDEGFRTALPAPLYPGSSCLVPMVVVAPDAAGDYELEVDLVHEHVRWFDCPLRLPITVEASPFPLKDAKAPDSVALQPAP